MLPSINPILTSQFLRLHLREAHKRTNLRLDCRRQPPSTSYTPGSQQTTSTSTLTLTFSVTKPRFTVPVGAHATTAELIERKAAGNPGGDPNVRHTVLKYIFHDCILESYEVSEKSGELLTTVGIKFGALSTEYTEQNPNAGAVVPTPGWSQVTTTASASSI